MPGNSGQPIRIDGPELPGIFQSSNGACSRRSGGSSSISGMGGGGGRGTSLSTSTDLARLRGFSLSHGSGSTERLSIPSGGPYSPTCSTSLSRPSRSKTGQPAMPEIAARAVLPAGLTTTKRTRLSLRSRSISIAKKKRLYIALDSREASEQTHTRKSNRVSSNVTSVSRKQSARWTLASRLAAIAVAAARSAGIWITATVAIAIAPSRRQVMTGMPWGQAGDHAKSCARPSACEGKTRYFLPR